MKFVTTARGAFVIGIAAIGVKFLLEVSLKSIQHDLMPVVLSIGLALVFFVVLILLHMNRHRFKGRKTLEIGRRALLLTGPDIVPFALAWRMIRAADLDLSGPQQWRFSLKTGGEFLLREEIFSRTVEKDLRSTGTKAQGTKDPRADGASGAGFRIPGISEIRGRQVASMTS